MELDQFINIHVQEKVLTSWDGDITCQIRPEAAFQVENSLKCRHLKLKIEKNNLQLSSQSLSLTEVGGFLHYTTNILF